MIWSVAQASMGACNKVGFVVHFILFARFINEMNTILVWCKFYMFTNLYFIPIFRVHHRYLIALYIIQLAVPVIRWISCCIFYCMSLCFIQPSKCFCMISWILLLGRIFFINFGFAPNSTFPQLNLPLTRLALNSTCPQLNLPPTQLAPNSTCP